MYEKNEKRGKNEEEAVFNMALDTLSRLGEILREIKTNTSNPEIPKEIKQEIKVNQTRQFFVQASPLLPVEYVEENLDEIMNLKPKQIRIMEKGESSSVKFKGYDAVYSPELEIYLDKLLIKLQIKLQERGHFMPSPEKEEGWD